MLIPTLSPSGISYSRYSVVDRSIGKIRMDAKVPTTLVVDQCGMLQELLIKFNLLKCFINPSEAALWQNAPCLCVLV